MMANIDDTWGGQRCATCGGPIPPGYMISFSLDSNGKQWVSHRFRTDCERYWEWAKSQPQSKVDVALTKEHLCECEHKRVEHNTEVDLVVNRRVTKACSKCCCLEFVAA